jgi:TRAP-type C4-dicarboxylate transport system permease small subunit
MVIGWTAGAALVVVVLIEIVSRPLGLPYFFASEFGSSLMAWLTFFALSEVARRRNHISARFLVDLLPGRVRRVVDATFGGVFMFVYVALLFAVALDLAVTTHMDGTRSQGVMRMPIAWPQFGMVAALAVFVLRSLLNTIADIAAAIAGRDVTRPSSSTEAVG